MTEGPVGKTLVKLTWPMVIGVLRDDHVRPGGYIFRQVDTGTLGIPPH